MGRRRVVNPPSDDSSSDSDDSTVTTNTRKKVTARNTNAQQGKGRPPSKKQRVPDDNSDDNDTSDQDQTQGTQPSTSGINTQVNGRSSPEVSESSGSESPDSDYAPVNDNRRRKKLPPPPQKRGSSPTRNSPRKKKPANYSMSKLPKLSQARDSINHDPKMVEALANKCVYFLLIEDNKKYTIRRKAIVQHVFKDEMYSPDLYHAVITKANRILKKTFGMELYEKVNEKDKYLIINRLKREHGINDYVDISRLRNQQHGLILYCLTVIFMNGNYITEDELNKALKQLRIDMTAKKPHPIFGDVKKYITVELVKQMYLNYECKSKDPPCYEFTWGLRAQQEFDKKDLLEFACKILDDTQPEMWILQYRDTEKAVKNSM